VPQEEASQGQEQAPEALVQAPAPPQLEPKPEEELELIIIEDDEDGDNKEDQVVDEFPDVFPDELPGMPPDRDIKFIIELLPGTAPIAKRPYRMGVDELEELKK
jgi:hypothetical protein